MKPTNSLLATALTVFSLSFAIAAKADTVTARCDVYPKGEDRATSSGLCTFSQRQGVVGIQLENSKRYDLTPVGNQPGNYRDQDGQPAYRQTGLGDQGQIYRLANESIYVYWDTAPYGQNSANSSSSNDATNSSSAASSASSSAAQPDAGTTVSALSDLVGARAGQAENAVTQRGYRFIKSLTQGDAVYSYWLEGGTDYCVTIRTEQGRYQSIVYAGGSADCAK
jgi:hypothetical protein